MPRHVSVKPPFLAALVMLTFATACTNDAAPVARNAAEVCEVEPQWALADTLGVEGHDSPEDAAEATALEQADLPGGTWYVVREEGNEAVLAPSKGPWRLEASRMDGLGWVVVTGLTCAGTTPGPDARQPLSADDD